VARIVPDIELKKKLEKELKKKHIEEPM